MDFRLFRTEKSVSGVAEARNDVRVIVQMIVKSGKEDIYVGMSFLYGFNAFGSADKAHELDMLYAFCFEHIYRVGG